MAIEPRNRGDDSVGDRLTSALAALPEVRAGERFTARVLARLDDPPRRAAIPRWAYAAIAASLLVIAAIGFDSWRERRAIAAAHRALAEIRREHREIADELNRLQAGGEPAVVYLGGDDDVDLVVDVSRVSDQIGAAASRKY